MAIHMYVGFIVSGEAERVRGKLSRPILTYYHNIHLQESKKRIQIKSFLSYILEASSLILPSSAKFFICLVCRITQVTLL
jgi:hypothetical protein